MAEKLWLRLASLLGCEVGVIRRAVRLLEENSVPFVARYRQTETGNLSPEALRSIVTAKTANDDLERRRSVILAKAPDEVKTAIAGAESLDDLEELWEPYKSKRKTKADAAREAWPRAQRLAEDLCFRNVRPTVFGEELAAVHLIAAELVATTKTEIRVERLKVLAPKGHCYHGYDRPLQKVPHHVWLALDREKLRLSYVCNEDGVFKSLRRSHPAVPLSVLQDAWTRLLKPRAVRRAHRVAMDAAKRHAAETFATNLSHLQCRNQV